MPQFYAYIYRDPSRNFQPIYVGKGQDDRAYDHLKRKDNHPFTHRLQLMKRNGIEPIINVVDMPSEALAHQCEIDTIARFGRKDLGLGSLLNLTDGGEGMSGYIPSVETRQKQSDANKGKIVSAETRKKQSDAKKGKSPPNKGKSSSVETRKKQSAALKGENHPQFGKKGEKFHMYGKSLSPETRTKQSDALKGKPRPRVTCPHCGTEGGNGIMHRWHFDNCKHKKVS